MPTRRYTLVGTCVPNTTITSGCQRVFVNEITVCRRLTTTTMTMSRNANGSFRPYFDEVGTLYVTSPLGITRVQNFVGYQSTCRRTPTEPDLSGFGSGNGSPCSSPSNSPTNVTPLFGNECGQFVVRLEVWNGSSPYGFSTCYLRGS